MLQRTAASLLVLAHVAIGNIGATCAADIPVSAPVATNDAASRMTVPPGFVVKLFAGEPDVRQPIALTFDTKGRLWVAECYSYPDWEMKSSDGKDRVLIFEDTDSDGHFDKRTLFLDNVRNLSGIEVGFGGIWLCSTPNLLFVPDTDRDDVPDAPAQIVLDGWDLKAQHNVFNSLTWGPDGWLYGCNGILSNSKVGPPGTPLADRVSLNCGVWRWHPAKKVFEAFASGTTNPWGLDFDDHGQAFITNCVIPHLFQITQGGHYQRMFGQDLFTNAYELIPTCADHVHWDTVEHWTDIRTRGVTPNTDRAGGGHAHSGAAIYLGDNWPKLYRNTILMSNIHGRRLNHDRLESKGSGVVGKHSADFLLANDPWFRGVALKAGPEGALYVLDWSDTGECHESDADGAHRENGRIYRVAFGSPKRSVADDLATAKTETLVALQTHENDWVVRQARRLLQERVATNANDLTLDQPKAGLRALLQSDSETMKRLRALWALHAMSAIDEPGLADLLKDKDEYLRAWSVRLLVDDRSRPLKETTLATLATLSREETSPKVRLALASALQRLDLTSRPRIAEGLSAHGEDAVDANLPLMIWYGVEPIVKADPPLAVRLAINSAIPTVRRHLARLVVSEQPAKGLDLLVDALSKQDKGEPQRTLDLLRGIEQGLQGRKNLQAPAGWKGLAERPSGPFDALEVRDESDKLSLIFGDPDAASRLKKRLADRSASPSSRLSALKSLLGTKPSGLLQDVIAMLDDPAIRVEAIRGLASFDDPAAASAILERYKTFDAEARDNAVNTLAARPNSALALLDALGKKEIARDEVSVTVARQLVALNRPEITEALGRVWGTIRATSAEKSRLLPIYKAQLGPETLKSADRDAGKTVFQKVCQSCHKLYGQGGDVGPELTGSNRDNLDYLLENILDPSAKVGSDYKLNTIATTDGRLLSGIIREQNSNVVVVQTANERVVVPRADIEEMNPSGVSMMPEGLLEGLSQEEVRDLIGYLSDRSGEVKSANH